MDKKDSFYEKYSEIKSSKGLKWEAFGNILNKSGDAIRMAFVKESLKDYEKEIIENYFGEKKITDTSDIDKLIAEHYDYIIENPLIKKDIEIQAIKKATFWINNPKEFKKYLNS